MNVALRAVYEALAPSAQASNRWRELIREICARTAVNSRVDPQQIAAALRAKGIRGPSGEWAAHLGQLGVLDEDGYPDLERAEYVAVALEIAGDSFEPVGPTSGWALVATVPPDLRALLHPPPTRQTGGVLLELIDAARTAVSLAAPFVDREGVGFLSAALIGAGRRGAAVAIVTSVGHGSMFSDLARLWTSEATGRLRVTEVATHLSPLGSHAKVLIVDSQVGYVGSANLTGAGLGRNVEIGVQVSGPQVGDLARLLSALERLGTTVLVKKGDDAFGPRPPGGESGREGA